MKEPVTPTKEMLGRELQLILPIGKSVNHCYITTRNGIKILNKETKQWFKTVEQIIKQEVFIQGWTKTELTKIVAEAKVYWKDYRTRDTNNLDKNLCDALEGIVLDNDCYLLIRWIDWEVDKNNPRIELKIRVFNPEKDKWIFLTKPLAKS